MSEKYLPKGMTHEDMEEMSSNSKKILGRIAGGVKASEEEVKALADDMRSRRRRNMFDSESLQRELYKIKNR